MIKDNLAKPLSKIATKSFTPIFNPNKLTIQHIFHNHWNYFLNDPIVKKTVRMISFPLNLKNGFLQYFRCWF